MIDHIGLGVSDYERSKHFYSRALEPLGISLIMEPAPGSCGFGSEQRPYFWIHSGRTVQTGTHIAFGCDTRGVVDAFYEAAIAAGATDNGPPGPRPYHPSYYGAFVLDPDGNNVEAVCHRPG